MIEGYVAVLDPDDPQTMTNWRRKDGRLEPWPPKARYGPQVRARRSDVPRGKAERALFWDAKRAARSAYMERIAQAVDADPVGAARTFAWWSCRCCICGRGLTEELSKVVGIGPDCRAGMPRERLALFLTPHVGRLHAAWLAERAMTSGSDELTTALGRRHRAGRIPADQGGTDEQ